MQLFRITMGAAMAAIPDAGKRRAFYEKVSKAFGQHDPSFELRNYGGIDEELDAVIEAQAGPPDLEGDAEPPVYKSRPPAGSTSDSEPVRRPGPYGRNESRDPIDAFRGTLTETGRTSSGKPAGTETERGTHPAIVPTAPADPTPNPTLKKESSK